MTVQNQTAAGARAAELTPADHAYVRDLKAAIENDGKLAARTVRYAQQPQEWKLVAMRECPTPGALLDCSRSENAVAYWREHITTHPFYNAECECAVVLLLNTQRRIKGHCLISVGTLEATLVHPREVFRAAVIASAAAIILMHNHPSGYPDPSQSDIDITHTVRRAGDALQIELLDHLIIGNPDYRSLRQLGHGGWPKPKPKLDATCLGTRTINRIYKRMTPDEQSQVRASLHVEYGPPHTWPPEFRLARQDALAAVAA
jgi:RadC-like JAB domain